MSTNAPDEARVTRLPRRLISLFAGLALYGISVALIVTAGLGADPWDVFHQGVARVTGASLGQVIIAVSGLVLLLWIPLRQRPGFGTLANAVLVGVFADLTVALIAQPRELPARVAMMLLGVALNGVATGMYIGAQFGPGPRDGLMTGLAARGRSVRLVRTGVEVVVLAAGWLLGGTVGVGTVVYALAIGPLAQVFIPLFSPAEPPRSSPLESAHDR
ncbi:membrane protein [soil metagenome]